MEGEHRLIVEDEDASKNVCNVSREREDTVSRQFWGWSPCEVYSHCLPRGLLVGSRVAAPGCAACSVSHLTPLPRGPLTVLGSRASLPAARSESTCAEERLPSWQSGSGDGPHQTRGVSPRC